MVRQTLGLALLALLIACEPSAVNVSVDADADAQGHSAPTAETIAANRRVAQTLPLGDQQDFVDARRGMIASDPNLRIDNDAGEPIWNMPSYAFIEGEAPGSVNPSLWRQAQLNNIHGLFEVAPGIYQLRGYDLANMTLIDSDNGWIVVDPLTTRETSAAALAFAREHLGDKAITAVIFTHSHIDHFGGILGIIDPEAGIPVIAPQGFLEEATSENVIAGTTMSRRSMLMYGKSLAHSPRGHVDTGLGKSPAFGRVGIVVPTDIVDRTPQAMTIDGVDFIFQNVPGSEAPAELTFYLPQKKAFCGAELVSRNMHNLYTLRGAKVRDALKWSAYINEATELFPDTQVYFASHHWPLWGNEHIIDFLKKQRDGYKYIHDQTVGLAAQGYTPGEIAEGLSLPINLQQSFPNRGYYGTTKHNARAVYQAYFGWYDGNPANLDPLPPVEAAKRYVNRMGGAQRVLEQARLDYQSGDYRWVAEVLNHLVFAEPENAEGRALLANTYDQLGYQAESGPWRDVYLSGAWELRHGTPKEGIALSSARDLLQQTPVALFFDTMAVMLDGEKADGESMVINIRFTDLDENFVLRVENAVLYHRAGAPDPDANASIEITHALFIDLLTGRGGASDILFSDAVNFSGSKLDLLRFFSLLRPPQPLFDIVTP